MPPPIAISNHGPLITATNYFDHPICTERSLVWCSVNAGAIRVLLPQPTWGILTDMRAGKVCVLSRGPWPAARLPDAVEIMWDDGTQSPFALHFSPESFDLLPGEPPKDQEWVCSVYVRKDGRPHKALERKCHWRRVPSIPWMKPWGKNA